MRWQISEMWTSVHLKKHFLKSWNSEIDQEIAWDTNKDTIQYEREKTSTYSIKCLDVLSPISSDLIL